MNDVVWVVTMYQNVLGVATDRAGVNVIIEAAVSSGCRRDVIKFSQIEVNKFVE